jgi:hypothetical protein
LEFLWIYFFCTKVLVFQLPSFTPNCVCFSTMLLKKHRRLTSNFFLLCESILASLFQ